MDYITRLSRHTQSPLTACRSRDGWWTCASGPHWPSLDDACRRALHFAARPIHHNLKTWADELSAPERAECLALELEGIAVPRVVVAGERPQWEAGAPLGTLWRHGRRNEGTCLDWCAMAVGLALRYADGAPLEVVWRIEPVDGGDHATVRIKGRTKQGDPWEVGFDPGIS